MTIQSIQDQMIAFLGTVSAHGGISENRLFLNVGGELSEQEAALDDLSKNYKVQTKVHDGEVWVRGLKQ